MNSKILDFAFAVVLFLCAYYTFDWYDWTQLSVSIVLILSGVNSLLRTSESKARREFGRACLRTAAIISVFLIVKMLIFG